MHAASMSGKQTHRRHCRDGFAFSRLHFGDSTARQCQCAHDLNHAMTNPKFTIGRFEGQRYQAIFIALDASATSKLGGCFLRLCFQFRIGKRIATQ